MWTSGIDETWVGEFSALGSSSFNWPLWAVDLVSLGWAGYCWGDFLRSLLLAHLGLGAGLVMYLWWWAGSYRGLAVVGPRSASSLAPSSLG